MDDEKIYEKITVNLPAVDLGKMEYLVEQGFYSTRTEFIRTAIKNEIDKNTYAIDSITREIATKEGTYFAIGVLKLERGNLELQLKQNRKVSVFVIGICYLSKDIDVNLVSKTISSFKVHGIKRGPKEVLEYLKGIQ